ncbi:MAG: membrane protein insertion efficiency factor YidD [Chlamydiales bacterium]|nr:membrane protein insertion efficiency factor YidD [Chlamydiales bacterium]
MKSLFIALIRLYQITLSPFIGCSCRFFPSCSEYAIEAFQKHGILKAFWLTLKRLAKCFPWNKGGCDFVP